MQRTRFITSSTDKHYSLDSEDDFRSGCGNVSHQQQFFSELLSPRRSQRMNYWYSWVQTIYYNSISLLICMTGSVWFGFYFAINSYVHVLQFPIISWRVINLCAWKRLLGLSCHARAHHFFNKFNFFKCQEIVNVLHLDLSGIWLSIGIKMFLQNAGKMKKPCHILDDL